MMKGGKPSSFRHVMRTLQKPILEVLHRYIRFFHERPITHHPIVSPPSIHTFKHPIAQPLVTTHKNLSNPLVGSLFFGNAKSLHLPSTLPPFSLSPPTPPPNPKGLRTTYPLLTSPNPPALFTATLFLKKK